MKLQSRQLPPDFRSQGWLENIVWVGTSGDKTGSFAHYRYRATPKIPQALAADPSLTTEIEESRTRYEWLEGYRPLLVAGMSYGEIQVKATSTGGLR